jgi:hypothetical protein
MKSMMSSGNDEQTQSKKKIEKKTEKKTEEKINLFRSDNRWQRRRRRSCRLEQSILSEFDAFAAHAGRRRWHEKRLRST